MTPDEIEDAIDLAVDCCDGAECSDDDVDRLCGYVSRMAEEIKRLQSLLPPSDNGEPVTAEWLESVGLLGEHYLCSGMRLCIHDSVAYVEYSSSGWYREFAAYELAAETRGDYLALARLFEITLLEGD